MTLNINQQRQAETQARTKILEHCPPVIVGNETWYNTYWQAANLQFELKFLRMQGKLKHDVKNPNLIHFKDGP